MGNEKQEMIRFRIKNYFKNDDFDLIGESGLDSASMKFIVFEYIIPRPIFQPIRRISKIHIFRKDEAPRRYGIKYSLLNIVTCMFGLPFGPIGMLSANKKNKTGIEISDDLRSRITLKDIQRGYVEINVYEGEFSSISKEIVLTFQKLIENQGYILASHYLAYVKYKRKHYFYLINTNNSELKTDQIQAEFKNLFDRNSRLEIIENGVNNKLYKRIIEDGFKL